MGTVYVTSNTMRRNQLTQELEPVLDLTPAEKFGRLEIVLANVPMNSLTGEYLLQMVCSKIKTFTDDDLVLAVGDPGAVAAVVLVAAERNNGRVRLLRWDRIRKEYMELSFDIPVLAY